MNGLAAALIPRIGIFWIFEGKIYTKTKCLQDIKAVNGFKDVDYAHYKIWDEILLQQREIYLYEYEDIPRGRVIYDIKNVEYIVYSNEDIINSNEAKNLITEAFNLNKEQILFQYDAHYKILELA